MMDELPDLAPIHITMSGLGVPVCSLCHIEPKRPRPLSVELGYANALTRV
jgi:hypothetical protein